MKVGKKLLSVLLAIIMMMSSMSVCFGTFSFTASAISADDDVKYVEELKKSFESEALETVFANYSTYFANSDNGVSTGTGKNSKLTNTVTVTLKTYDQYVAFAELLNNLYGSILQASSFKSFGAFQEDGDTRACCDAATVLSDINKSLGFSTSSNEYKFLSTFLKNGKYTHSSTEKVEFGKTAGIGTPSPSNCPQLLTDTVNIVANDDIYKGYLADLADSGKKYTDVEDSIDAGNTYSITMHRAVWESKNSHRSSGRYIKTYYYYGYFHNIIDTGSSGSMTQNAPSVSKTISKIDDQLDAFAAKLDEVRNLTYSDMLAKLADGTIESYLNSFNSAYKKTVEYCGDETETRSAYIDDADTSAGTYNYIDVTTANSVFNRLFSNRLSEIANFYALYKSALASDKYMDYAQEWKEFAEANPNYGVFSYPSFDATYDQMVADYQDFLVIYNHVQAGSQQFVEYVTENGIIDLDYYTNFTDNVDVYNLKATAAAAKAAYESYSAIMDTMTTEEKSVAYSVIKGYIGTINSHTTQEKNAIFAPAPSSNADYKNLINLEDELYCDINENVLYFAEKAYLDYTGNSTASIIDLIAQAKEKQVGLTNLYNEMVAQNGPDRADALLGTVRTAANDMINGLYNLLAARLTAEVDHGWDIYVALNQPTSVEDIQTYLQMQKAITTIETKIYDYLVEQGKTGLLSAETISHYETLIKGVIFTSYTAYAKTCGFNDYVQSFMNYEDRNVYATPEKFDEVKTETYVVDEAKLLDTIEALDKIIKSDLLGSIINKDGSPLDLGVLLSDLVKDFLFTDDFINTVMQLLYPLVVDEFDKVFSDLPRTVKYSGIDVDVNYKYNLYNTLAATSFNVYPDLVAKTLDATKYADNIEKLNRAADDWESSNICDEEGKFTLTWGVADKKAEIEADGVVTAEEQAEFDQFFYDAFEDATTGLYPLLAALIANQSWNPVEIMNFAAAYAVYVVDLDIHLQLGATANQGYANLLVPIYEALGLTSAEYSSVSAVESSHSIADILEMILAPIFTFLGKLGEKPVDTLLGVLPNVIYSLAFNMVPSLLNMLDIDVTYNARATGTLELDSVLGGKADITVGDMLIKEEDAVLKPSMFAGGINSLLSFFGLSIPEIDQAKLATLGKLVKIKTARQKYVYSGLEGTGNAYHITADKAGVGYYLLSYLLNTVKDEAALTSLLGLFMVQKDENGEPVLNATGEKIPDEEAMAGIKKVIYEDLNLDEMDIGDVIAAIVELANQVEYKVDEYYWYDGSKNTPLGTTAAADIYLNPNNDWTEDKAQYLYNNLETLLGSIFTMAGLDLDATTEEVDGTIEAALSGTLNGLFTNKTVIALAKLLGSISDLNALLAGDKAEGEAEAAPEFDINKLIKDELGIDLSVYAVYANLADETEIDFGVTDAASFVAALTSLLNPLKPLLDFILGGKDLTLIDSAITLQGYKGYDNAIIPLLEALGATPAAYTENADTLALTLNALVGVINKLTTNDPAVANDGTIYTIIDMLPGVLYYLSSNALSQGIDKLLTPVYAILDTIRPIYNINLNELLAGIEVDFDKDGVKEPLGLDIKNIGWEFIFGLLNNLLGLDLSALAQVIYDICDDIVTTYTSASKLESTWKKGAYGENFDQADMLTVILSFVLEWATVKENAEKLDELLKTNGIIAALGKVFADVEITYGTPNWMYWFKTEEAFNAYLAGDANIPNTLAALDWENIGDNDWDYETAKYFAENLPELVDIIIGMINKDKVDDEGNALPTTLSTLLSDLVNGLVNAETLNDLVGMITGLLGDIDENLIATSGYLLDVDLAGLKAYTCEAEINSISDFINELANVLDTYASGLINWLFFGDDYRFAKKSDSTDTIVINGGFGYTKGLAIILEALGCALPAEANTKSVLGALATRVEAILANPVDEVLALLPNLVYFLNANGAGVAFNNLLQPVYVLLDKLSAFGLNVNLADLLKFTKEDGTEIAIDLANLSLENVVTIIEGATGLPLDAAENILVNFCTGKITKGAYIYRMDAAKEDVITILLVVALELISDDEFAAKLDEMLGTDGIVANIKGIFSGSEIIYKNPNWNYMEGTEKEGVIEYVNAIASYPNDWTEDKAEYLAENLPELVDSVIKMVEINGVKYDSLAALLQTNVNIFTTETLNSLLDLIKNLLGNIDAELLEVGFLLDVDLAGLMAYEVPADIDTVTEFADTLAFILGEYATGVVEWLLLGRDFNLVVKDKNGIEAGLETDGSYITVTGAHGYAEGLALLLEALGCENLPEVYDVENLDTAATVKAVLASLAARIDEIFAKPVEEVLDLLPNLIYFLDADGVDAVISNTTAALMALAGKLEVFGVKLDINSLVNLPELMGIADKYAEGDDVISLDNLTLKALLKALSLMTELDFTELENVLVPFALGEAVKYDSVSANDAYKMVYKTDLDKHDMISVIVTAALRLAVENEDNAAKLDAMLGTEIISALKVVFAEVEITYAAPTWEYPLADNGTVDAMKYSITYPNNWTEATAKYVTENLPEIGDLIAGLIDSNYDTLSALLKANVNVFTSENLQAIVDLIANLLEGIDDGLLDAAGVLLGADVVGLKKYEAPASITTADAFAAELANVLNTYAKGVVEWLLLGNDYKFFVKEVKDGAPVDFIVINGANGYAEGLALLLEALGCENLPEADGKTEDIVTGVLASVASLINKVLNNPVGTVVEILPNLLYFLNANGVAAVVDNTLAAVTALLTKLEAFGLKVDINELVNLKSLMGLEDTDAAISLDNLSMAAVLEAVGLMVGLDLTLVEDVLVGFALGQVKEYDSVSANAAYKMTYADEFDKHDMVTVLVNLVLLTIADEANEDFVKGLVGDAAYEVILNLCNGVAPVEIQDFDWKFTDKADTGEVFSAFETSELYEGYSYGPLYTKEMAEYIADNFGTFVDNILYLLGIEINGITVDNLTDLINGLLNGSLYNSTNVIAIRDALAGVLDGIEGLEVNGKNVGKYIAAVLANSEVADISAVADVEVPEFTEDRAQFVTSLCAVLEPLYPVLKWALADEDFAFFTDLDKTDLIKLEGAEGYAYGILPLLETLECEEILAPEAYYAAVEADGSVLLTSILNPLLNRVDAIVAEDPASEILSMLPNLIYFINSNGVDTVIKNTLNAVYTLLSAIKPIAEIDLYELLGLEFLATFNFETLFQMVLDLIADATGYEFKNLKADAVAELTVGTLESYTSLNTKTAYKMVYNAKASKADMVTVVLRLIVTFVMHENNREMLLGLLKNNLGMNEDAEGYLRGVLDSIASLATGTYLGMDQALAVIYYLFYSADIGSGELANGIKDINAEWQNILKELSVSENPDEITIGGFLANFLDKYMDDVFTSEGFAPNGLIAFFQRIIEWFNKIVEWFKNLFN